MRDSLSLSIKNLRYHYDVVKIKINGIKINNIGNF